MRPHFAGLLAFAVIFGLLGGNTASADTNGASGFAIEAVFGTAVEVRSPDAIVVATSSGLVNLIFNDESELKIGTEDAEVSDVVEGDRVVSTARRNAEGDLIAIKTLIRVVNAQPITKHIVGVVSNISDDQLSIQTRFGDVVTVVISAGVDVPQVGDGITLVARLDRSTGVLTASGFELTSVIITRIENARDLAANAAEQERLSQIAIDARSKHLTALDDATRALQRVIESGQVDQETLDNAAAQISEIKKRFSELQGIYENAARDRNEELPLLKISGALVEAIGGNSLTIVPRGEQGADPFSVVFSFDPETTRVELPKDLLKSISPDAENPLLLADVKELIDPGSELDVKYSVNIDNPGDRSAVLIRVKQPRLVEGLEAVLDVESQRAFHGVITLVEINDSLEDAIGVVIVANERQSIKVAAKVSEATEITLDGAVVDIAMLATGQAVDIQFESAGVGVLSDISGSGATLRALAIRARSSAPATEVHISGIVESIEVDERAITIRPTDGSLIRLIVDDEASIIRNGHKVDLENVKEGDLVVDAVRPDPESESLTSLVVVARTNVKFTGTITGIGIEPARLLVAGKNSRSINVLITNDTWVILDGRRVAFGDLQTGLTVVSGVYTVTGRNGALYNVATVVSVESPKVDRATGVITAVNVQTGTLTLVSGSSTSTRIMKLRLPEEPLSAILLKDGRTIESLRSVERGDLVDEVLYVIESGIIQKLSVVSDNFIRSRGTLLSVAANHRFISVELANGEQLQLWTGPGSDVRLNGRKVDSLTPVAEMLQREREADSNITALITEVLFIRDSIDSDWGVIISVRIQIKAVVDEDAEDRDNRLVEVTVSGVIEAIHGRSWVIDGHVFVVNDNTEFFGDKPEIGLVANAALVSNIHGTFVAQAVSVAGRPDVSPTRGPIDVRPDSTGTGDKADDGSATFEIRGEIAAVSNRAITIDTAVILIGANLDVDRNLLLVGALVRVKVRRAADRLVHAISIEVVRAPEPTEEPPEVTRPGVVLPPKIEDVIGPSAGVFDEIEGPVARLGENIVIVPNNILTLVLLGGTENLDSRFKITPVSRDTIMNMVDARLAAQLEDNSILKRYDEDTMNPLFLIEVR